MQYAIIDRFEGDMAVLEMPDGAMRDLPRAALPYGARARVNAEAQVIEFI